MIFLDIETASHPVWLAREAAKAGATDWAAYALDHAGDGALSPWRGIVTCWSVLDRVGSTTRVTVSADDEAASLGELSDLLRPHHVEGRKGAPIVGRDPIVTHNGAAFDWPFLRVRGLRCGVPSLAARLWQAKPWSGDLIDTASPDWSPRPPHSAKGWEYSLDAWADSFGIVRPEQLPGSECPAAWYRGEYDRVAHHCADDVRVLREVYLRLAAGRGA